jgi:hypothetical protein
MAGMGGKSAAASGFGMPIEVHPLACQKVCGLKFLPIESHADPDGIRGQRHVVVNHERALSVLLYREGMDLDPACVFLAGNKAYMQLLHPMATNRNIGLFGQGCDLKKAGDAAAI